MGWIKLHKSLIDWGWYKDANTKAVFIHLLLTANFEPSEYMGEQIERGQVVYGRKELGKNLTLSEREVRTALTHLKATNELTSTTTSRFSIGTLVNYSKYQDLQGSTDQQNDQQNDFPATSKRPASDQQATTSKNIRSKEFKNLRKDKGGGNPPDTPTLPAQIIEAYNAVCISLPRQTLTNGRTEKLRARIKEHPDIEWWHSLFRRCQTTPFLTGKNDRGWTADFEWLIKNDSNALRVLEGKYDGNGGDTTARAANGRPIQPTGHDGEY